MPRCAGGSRPGRAPAPRGTGRPAALRRPARRTPPPAGHRPGHRAGARRWRGGVGVTIEHLQAHYGFTKTPFGRALAPQMLHRHASHGEAVARIGWCIAERALGVVTGEVGAGKTVAVRAALAG